MSEQPMLLTARCIPPAHPCRAVHQRALRGCVPVLVVHLHPEHADVKLFVSKPWELTAESKRGLLDVFAAWAWVDDMVGAKCLVDLCGATWSRLPVRWVGQFLDDIRAHAFFRRIELP